MATDKNPNPMNTKARRHYIMENCAEALRLELKTDPDIIRENALWAGIETGMQVADLGCGPGLTTHLLNEMVQPGGTAMGLDISENRITYARKNYQAENLNFVIGDIREPLEHLGTFDLVWIRFVLEHHRKESFDIVANCAHIIKPGGILCLIDLDYNCLTHYGISEELENALFGIMAKLQKDSNFDPYVGRKLYTYLYDLCFRDINVQVSTHHLIYGPLNVTDRYNWGKKVEIAARNSGYDFSSFKDGFDGFKKEFYRYFNDPRRFTYTPVIIARGRKHT